MSPYKELYALLAQGERVRVPISNHLALTRHRLRGSLLRWVAADDRLITRSDGAGGLLLWLASKHPGTVPAHTAEFSL